MADIAAVEETRTKVHDHLEPFEDVTFADDGSCTLVYGSAMVTVTVEVFDEDQAVVKVSADCVRGATPSPELYHHIATYRTEIGHLRAVDEADGTVTIQFRHGLIGEFVDPGELRMVVIAIAIVADQLDDDLAARFGGQVHHVVQA